MSITAPTPSLPFTGVKGRALAALLQLDFVRFHRVQLGYAEFPTQYERFLTDVVGSRIAALPGRVGIFGTGVHTGLLLKAVPALEGRVECLTDNNKATWGQERFGITVLPPTEAITRCAVIVLSTAVYQQELRADLKKMGFTGAIVAMDDVVPPSWFLAAA